jgi:hypothetical protein
MSKPEKTSTTEIQEAVVQPNTRRRNFLIGASVGSVGAAAALISGSAVVKPEADATPETETKGKGYRESEHIRRYYGTTRI